MGAGTRQYRQADTGNLGKFIGDKIVAARQQAAEERKYKEENSPEIETGAGYFFGKALGAQFGGDLINRTRGSFSTKPTSTQDPALSKQQRFQNLVRGETSSVAGVRQLGLEGIREDEFTQTGELKSWLTPLLNTISRNNQKVAQGLANLGSEQSKSTSEQQAQNQGLGKLGGMFDALKSYLRKDLDLEKQDVSIQQQELDFTKDAAADTKRAISEDQLEGTGDTAGVNQLDKEEPDRENRDAGSDARKRLLDRLGGALGGDGGGFGGAFGGKKKKRGRRPGSGARYQRRFGKKPGGFRMPKVKGGGKIGLALTAAELLLGGLGGGQQKFAAGAAPLEPGVYDNPTTGTLMPGQGVVPLNRNNSFSDLFDRVEKKGKGKEETTTTAESNALSKAIQLPTLAGGALLISTVTSVFNNMGGLSSLISPVINTMFRPIAKVFGLPANIIGSVTTTEAKATEQDSDSPSAGTSLSDRRPRGKKGGKKNILQRMASGASNILSNLFGGGNNNTGGGGRNEPAKPEKSYNVSGGKAFTSDMFGSRGFGTRDGLGSGASASGHTGRDVPLKTGTPISIIPPGEVVESSTGPNGGYGNFVTIKLDDGRYIKSNHHAKNLVRKGDRVGIMPDGSVKAFATVGSTGLSTGSHMHIDLGTGYDAGPARITGLMNPDNFILNGMRQGGDLTATERPSPSAIQPPKQKRSVAESIRNLSLADDFRSGMLEMSPDPVSSDADGGGPMNIFLTQQAQQQQQKKQNELLDSSPYGFLLSNPTSQYIYGGRTF